MYKPASAVTRQKAVNYKLKKKKKKKKKKNYAAFCQNDAEYRIHPRSHFSMGGVSVLLVKQNAAN